MYLLSFADYKKTSLMQSIEVLEQFVTGMEKGWQEKRLAMSGERWDQFPWAMFVRL